MFDFLKNAFLNRGKYKTDSSAVIISCFFNPQHSPYRIIAFQKFYHTIKHLNHRIIECLIDDDKPQLPETPYIKRVKTNSLLWHKESLLNKIVSDLPSHFRYVFWVDADVLFMNDNWLIDGVAQLQEHNIIQPFEHCFHLERNKLEPVHLDVEDTKWKLKNQMLPKGEISAWRSFCSNIPSGLAGNTNYDLHGHVGFAWGARRSLIEQVPLYDRALIGGADHIIAHAAAGHIPHSCITKSFTEMIDEVNDWSRRFYALAQGKVGYVTGDLYHLWHGDIKDRQYLKRIKEFTDASKTITMRDENGLHINQPVIPPVSPVPLPSQPRKHGKEPVRVTPRYSDAYMRRYYRQREATKIHYDGFNDYIDDNFYRDMGYTIFQYVENYTPPVWMAPSYTEYIPEFDGTPPNDLIQDMPPLPVPVDNIIVNPNPMIVDTVSQEVPSLPQAAETNNWEVTSSEEKSYEPVEVPSLPQANDVSTNWEPAQTSDADVSTPSEVPSLPSDVNTSQDWDANFS
jgi:hypothetical protein